MANKMLVDASHPEETRVVVVKGNRVEEFDFEAANRRQLRGNIYLAKVTRVEPSLQAAFVEYGGNRHGFLAFAEIHPDYYQIPVADRQALLADERRAESDEDEDDNGASSEPKKEGGDGGRDRRDRGRRRRGKAAEASSESVSESADGDSPKPTKADEGENGGGEVIEVDSGASADQIEAVGGDDAMEEMPQRALRSRRQYKIQEVIKRRQVLLVQCVKEERGNKGAALTTYLSLAGRYSVLMPNTARGGGISRKITNAVDRKRLKTIASDLDVPDGMGVILRTAGASRTKAEVKRDFEYLLRMWESVRDLTLKSTAPTLVYEEGSLIKRSIRDLYNKEIDEIIVSGDEGYREAKDFMRMLMPSHAKNVHQYKDAAPLFQGHGVEAQLDAMFLPQVQLKSGGYLVINQTEALVSIDVNSGRATREHNIEDTAFRTNLEASEEVARQLRLRDLAGLIVIDFIDMDEGRNNRAVERRLKECLKNDRARIQVGRISHFGLMEMSRQRIRTGVLESSTEVCAHCGGTGHVRAVPSVALQILRALEEQLLKSATHNLVLRTKTKVAIYVLNQKRGHLSALEARFGVTITVQPDETVTGTVNFIVERGELAAPVEARPITAFVQVDTIAPVEVEAEEPDEVDEEEEATEDAKPAQRSDNQRPMRDKDDEKGEGGRRKRRRRRRRRGDRDGDAQRSGPAPSSVPAGQADENDGGDEPASSETVTTRIAAPVAEANGDGTDEAGKKRRRGRRGGRRNKRDKDGNSVEERAESDNEAALDAVDDVAPAAEVAVVSPMEVFADKGANAEDEPVAAPTRGSRKPKGDKAPKRERAPKAEKKKTEAIADMVMEMATPVVVPLVKPEPAPEQKAAPREVIVSNPDAYTYVKPDETAPKKAGWWSKK